MAKKVSHGRSKLISSYGGVGSIIETPDASVIIETFDNWNYPNINDEQIKNHIISDNRLINRLRYRFPKLKYLVSIPEEGGGNNVEPQANCFPKWFYCPKCHRFKPIHEWKKAWQRSTEFNLKCFNSDCKEERLEQVRFIMTCDSGHIQDLPWDLWNNRTIEESENDDEIKIKIDFSRKCCDTPDLRYIISQENTDLSGIHIKCNNCKKSATLKGIFSYTQKCSGLKYWNGKTDGRQSREDCDERMSVKIKTSNSIYYANTLSSIWIPQVQPTGLTPENCNDIDEIVNEDDFEQIDLEKYARRKNIPIEIIEQYLRNGETSYVPEIVYRKDEYDYFLNQQQPDDNSIRFKQINVRDRIDGFEQLVKINRLKKITVQTSFTRNEPIDIDNILIGDTNEHTYQIKRQPVSKNGFETRLLPAIENYGEGILFVLDNQKLENWETIKAVDQRVELIRTHAQDSDWQSHKIEATKLSARKILIHTLAHLLIREFEYVCGYPMASLQERLYVSENMNGFLISAYDGHDGYLGGLTKLCNNIEKLHGIIKTALQRAKNCSLDPICYESEGQGVAQLNLAACHSCALIPDASCEMGNLFLDRRLVIDTEFGYFNI